VKPQKPVVAEAPAETGAPAADPSATALAAEPPTDAPEAGDTGETTEEATDAQEAPETASVEPPEDLPLDGSDTPAEEPAESAADEAPEAVENAEAADDDAEPETPRPEAPRSEAPRSETNDDDDFELPVPSEGPRGPGARRADDDELSETVVWTGSSRRSSGDDDDDAVVSSLGARARHPIPDDLEVTVNLTADLFPVQERDDLSEPTRTALPDDEDVTHTSLPAPPADTTTVTHQHLRGLIEALVFASDRPLRPGELARRAQAPAKEIKLLLGELRAFYTGRGIQLDEVGGAFTFRTNPVYAPFVRELTGQKPVKLTRTQVETLSILAYRQPITRPEIDDIRGVDSGPVLKMLLERDLIKILGKKDEPGRPILYGTTPQFLEFFGIPSLKDLPTLREFTELNDDSKRVVERELGESYEAVQASLAEEASEHLATNDLGAFEPEEEDSAVPEDAASVSRVDEALREIERASLEGDPDDDAPELPVPAEDPEPAPDPADEGEDDTDIDDDDADEGDADEGDADEGDADDSDDA